VAEVTQSDGLQTARFAMLQGEVVVRLPDDAARGDRITGTVRIEPVGATPEERQSNTALLTGYVVEIEEEGLEGERTTPGRAQSGVLSWAIPATLGAGTLVLRDPEGREVARAPANVGPEPLPPDQAANPTPSDFRLPPIGQAGAPITIEGPFDGDFSTSEITVGGQPAELLAESPRRLVATSPPDVVGPTTIVVRESGVAATGSYRAIVHELTADRLTLLRGERATLTDTIRGLQGLESPIESWIENDSPTVVRVEGGDLQRIEIRPEEVSPEGTHVFSRVLSGIRAGTFTIRAGSPTLAILGHSFGTSREHAYELTKAWQSKEHRLERTRAWPRGHEVDRTQQDSLPPHGMERSREWEARDHSETRTRLWQGWGHSIEGSQQYRRDRHDLEKSRRWLHSPHVYAFTKYEETGRHQPDPSRRWREEHHDYLDTKRWGERDHAYEDTRREQRDRLEHSEATTEMWTDDQHADETSREWRIMVFHSYTLSRAWRRDDHVEGTSRGWRNDGHAYETSRRWQQPE
jgi:hypothetical protein